MGDTRKPTSLTKENTVHLLAHVTPPEWALLLTTYTLGVASGVLGMLAVGWKWLRKR